MNIGEKISELRKNQGLSQEAFAEKLGVSRQSVSKWESGNAMPDIDKIVAMSEIFGISTDSLLKESAEKSPPPADFDKFDTEEFEPVSEDADAPAETEYFTAAVPVSAPEEPEKKPTKKKRIAEIVAAILAVCIVITSIAMPLYYGGIREAWWALCGGKVEYPYVLVHGLGGWGEGDGINDTVQYWGATACNLTEYLNEEGHEVYAPSVGPFSSAWDRACELYAQLTGTRVDYGQAHSKEHNHARYGEDFTAPLFEGWGTKINGGQRIKINLVGHSFGGATVRLLTSLLAYGNEDEQNATGKDTSPLFTGGKGDWVYSVTTLCAPHNGSSLTNIIDDMGGLLGIDSTTELLIDLCFSISGIASPVSGIYDLKLDHFGVDKINGDEDDIKAAVASIIDSGTDNAVYDLSPDGAAALNETIISCEDVYYFSYAYSTTRSATLLSGQKPSLSTLPILYLIALAMGTYTGTTPGGIELDESWQENDGLVSVVSAEYPSNQRFAKFTADFSETPEDIERNIWNVAPVREGDHGTVIGLNADEGETKAFYDDLFETIDNLKR